ncbi:hypothetical protein N9L23_00110 [Alphaproteobacteria bacterium]|nr:hypothetical protein [Alphaproteobacteria bacterium]
MRYSLVNIGPNNWFDYKADAFFGFLATLHELGMDVDFKHNKLSTDRTNIVCGSDWLVSEGNTNVFTQQGLDYVLVEGEFFYNKTLNGKLSFNIDLYLDYLNNAKEILTPYIHNVKEFAKYNIKAQYYRWGDFPGRFEGIRNLKKLHASSYYGLLKGHRKHHFDQLSRKLGNNLFLASSNNPAKFRDYCLNFSASILSLKCQDVEFVNPIRISEALANGVPVFHNHTYDPDGYTNFCEKLPPIQELAESSFWISADRKKEAQEYSHANRLADSLRECCF